MMLRRSFLKLSAGAVFAALGGCSIIPPIPAKPDADAHAALGWIIYDQGAYTLLLPRIEMGQGIETALKQVAVSELGIGWGELALHHQDTDEIAPVRSTVGSESVMLFALPLARACAALRDAIAAGVVAGEITVSERPMDQLRSFSGGGLVGTSPASDGHRAVIFAEPLFAGDIRQTGMVYGRVLRSPIGMSVNSEPRSWNEAAARRVPGFLGLSADERLRRGNSYGLGIWASTPSALDAVTEVLELNWSVGDRIPEDISWPDLDHPSHQVRDDLAMREGDWDIDISLEIAAAPHNAVEARSAVARVQQETTEIWVGSQDAFFVRDTVADRLGVSSKEVRVHGMRIGGGFGGRAVATVEVEAAVLAHLAGKPVKVQWTRDQEMREAFHRPPARHRVRASLTKEGGIGRWRHGFATGHVIFTSAALPDWLQSVTDMAIGDKGSARGAEPPYVIDQADIGYDLVELAYHTGPWRGLGAGPNGLAVELAVDALARSRGQDPIRFRLAVAKDPRLAQVLERVATLSEWERRAKHQQSGDVRLGLGVGCGIYKGVSYGAVVAEAAVNSDGRVRVVNAWAAHECGTVLNPDQVKAQCEGNFAWSLGLVLSDNLAEEVAPPVMDRVPALQTVLVGSDDAPSGAGETLMAAAPGAIANAVAAALGRVPSRFPLRAEDLRWS